jgi:hypothetical protein
MGQGEESIELFLLDFLHHPCKRNEMTTFKLNMANEFEKNFPYSNCHFPFVIPFFLPSPSGRRAGDEGLREDYMCSYLCSGRGEWHSKTKTMDWG